MDIYRNLHKSCWSLRPSGGHVAHADQVMVLWPRFAVQKAGQARVRREKRKVVHAFVRANEPSHIIHFSSPVTAWVQEHYVRLTYNPYQHDTFVEAETGRYVKSAIAAVLTADGKLYAQDVEYLEAA